MEEEEPFNWSDYESGPYCEHWNEAMHCDRLCECSHECKDHFDGHCDNCNCKKFKDAGVE